HAGYDTLYGGAGDDELHGGADQSTLHGGEGNDLLYGGASNDLLTGGAGDDTLNGGDGYDRISGGAGADVFVATALSEMDGSAYDHVTDFSVSEGDRLDVSHLNVSDLATVTQLMQDRAHSDGASFTYYRNSQQSETILDDVSTSQVRAGQVILSTVESDDTIYGSDG
ncbi:M10 family metallopeptidase C-terminal domain-containing protein, partial [Maritimibacter alkaliphilus]|uniref:M10 family metallopeptidase C-terminal domain-containing protein n=1 Tax=Maritimibacter alkaliphilus TaxID=404236 RepID=UPI001C95A853